MRRWALDGGGGADGDGCVLGGDVAGGGGLPEGKRRSAVSGDADRSHDLMEREEGVVLSRSCSRCKLRAAT